MTPMRGAPSGPAVLDRASPVVRDAARSVLLAAALTVVFSAAFPAVSALQGLRAFPAFPPLSAISAIPTFSAVVDPVLSPAGTGGLGSLAAQQPGDSGAQQPGDAGGRGDEEALAAAAGDTVPATDSTRLRILRQLEALGRPPGADSLRQARDSAELARRTGRDQGRTDARGGGGGIGIQDSLANSLRELDGYVITDYSGATAEFEARERQLVLRGEGEERPRVARQGMSLAADSAIVYNERDERVRTVGGAEYTPDVGDPVASQTMVLDLTTQRGSAMSAETRYAQGGTDWYVSGDLPSVESELVYGSHTSFTSCDLEEPHYHFETDEIKIHQGNILVARPVRLYFADVPVAWLPFIAQSLSQGRASGLLTPRFSINDIVRSSSGYSRRVSNVGFYWAMSDYSDATVALDWFSDNFTGVTGQIRYAWNRQFLNGNLDFRQYWSADGSTQQAFSTGHSWQISERTRFSMDARYASNESFVRRNSFNPREVTQSIRSQGGLNHRFDWGSVNVGANRQQYLSDGRVEMTLPNVSLSLNPVTFFQAPPGQGGFFNNITWSGSSSFRRNVREFDMDQPLDSTFQMSRVDEIDTQASASSGFNLGNFSISQSASYSAGTQRGIPDFFLTPGIGADSDPAARAAAGLPPEVQALDLTREELSWSGGASYQQRLIGSTTLTPRLQVSGRSIRSDTLSAGSGFVAAPMRTSFGARLKTDLYGFFPGVGSFEQIRHKFSPGFSYDYSPEVTPSQLQRDVFGSGEIQTRSVVSLNLNQTIEARLTEEAEEAALEQERADSIARVRADSIARAEGRAGVGADTLGVDVTGQDGQGFGEDGTFGGEAGFGQGTPGQMGDRGRGTSRDLLPDEGLERLETGRTVMLLGLQTSVVTYDFVQADSAGSFIGGFRTTSLNNSVRSDYLQGISLQFSHDLFEVDEPGEGDSPLRPGQGRSFSPHLSSVNLSFSLSSSSALFRWLGLAGSDDGDGTDSGAAGVAGGPGGAGQVAGAADRGPDESSIVPGGGGPGGAGGLGRGGVGEWSAQFSYSLQRPRMEIRPGSQMLQMNFRFQPTEQWDVSWSTAYDLNRRRFNDHSIRLTRDLHRWQANFDFLQTATGNWAFRFSVALLDNRDLEFDYRQQSPVGQR